MGLEIYKPGQGKLARYSAYGLGVALVLFGARSLYATINVPGNAWVEIPVFGELSPYHAIAFAVAGLGILGLHLVLNRPNSVDMLIDTEQELKKVSWPSGTEVKNATIVVVIVTFTMAMLLWGFDRVLQMVFGLVWGK